MGNMNLKLVDKFEYKGRKFDVFLDEYKQYYFQFNDGDEYVTVGVRDIKSFISSPFSHKTVGNANLEIIEKSVKLNSLIYHLGDLKQRIKQYK